MSATNAVPRFDPRRPPTLEQVEKALAAAPGTVDLLRRRAALLLDAGDLAGASADLRTAMAKAGGNADSRLLAVAARAALLGGRLAECERLALRGLGRSPGYDELYGLIGAAFQRQGSKDKAVTAYEAAVNLNPFRRTYRIALAQALESVGDVERAERVYRQALVSDSNFGDAALNLANLLQSVERYEESLAYYRKSIEVLGLKGHLLSNLGALMRKMGRYDDAQKCYRRAMCLTPEDGGVYYNLGNLYRAQERLPAAIGSFRRAVTCRPASAELHWNLALALLSDGQLGEGFAEYEWRWQYDQFPSKRRNFPQPQWQGEPFDGKTLLLHTEQGVGDVLQYLRFIPEIVARKGRTGRIVLECHENLLTLMDGFPGIDAMIARFATPPPVDMHLPLLSATRVLRIETVEQLPKSVPYLPVPPGPGLAIPEARADLLKVGFVFGGNPLFPNDRARSTKLQSWMPLFGQPGVQFFCLQKGEREPEVAGLPESVIRLNGRLHSFRDTAVAIGQLDLVITTCTSVAHLAGALGHPFWVLLSHNADWRWLVGRDDSPWYPTARLFRQTRLGDWDGVFARVSAALREVAAARQAGSS